MQTVEEKATGQGNTPFPSWWPLLGQRRVNGKPGWLRSCRVLSHVPEGKPGKLASQQNQECQLAVQLLVNSKRNSNAFIESRASLLQQPMLCIFPTPCKAWPPPFRLLTQVPLQDTADIWPKASAFHFLAPSVFAIY